MDVRHDPATEAEDNHTGQWYGSLVSQENVPTTCQGQQHERNDPSGGLEQNEVW